MFVFFVGILGGVDDSDFKRFFVFGLSKLGECGNSELLLLISDTLKLSLL